MNVTSAKLARQAARPLPLTIEDHDWDRLPDRLSVDPQHSAEVREILGALRSAVEQKLTDRQRRVFIAVALNEVAIDELAQQLGANRNAIYKTLFDARRKLLLHLEAMGYRISATALDNA
jgi:RNA polymerase sigma-70 factor (ECF subfamily)